MKIQEILRFKRVLEQEMARVLERKSRTHGAILEEGDQTRRSLYDEGELVESNSRLAVNIELVKTYDQTLRKIRAALRRIEDGAFGQCSNEECESAIPPVRLEALPYEDKCLRCKESEEAGRSKPVYGGQIDAADEEEQFFKRAT